MVLTPSGEVTEDSESGKLIRRQIVDINPRHAAILMHKKDSADQIPASIEDVAKEFDDSIGGLYAHENITDIPMRMPTWAEVQDSNANAFFLVYWGQPLAIAIFVMLVQHTDSGIRTMTWKVLSGAVSLGCTALLFQAYKMAWFLIFGLTEVSLGIHALIDFLKLMVLMWLMPRMMKACWNMPLAREVFSMLGAHFIGFASIQCAQSILTRDPFWNSPALYFAGVVMLIVLNAALMVFNRTYRYGLLKLWREDEAVWRPWMDQCDFLENEAMGLVVGFMLSTVFRFAIIGKLPGAPGYPHYNKWSQVNSLLLTTIPFCCFALFVSIMIRRFKEGLEIRPLFKRVLDTTKACIVLTASWLFFFLVQWESYFACLMPGVYGTLADNMASSMTSVMISVLVACLLIAVYGKISQTFPWAREEGLIRDITMVFVLMLGLSWETTMSIAVDAVAGDTENSSNGDLMFIFLMVMVVICFLPVWCFYILPHTLGGEEQKGSAPATDEEKVPLVSATPASTTQDARRRGASRSRAGDGAAFDPDEKADNKSANEEISSPPVESTASRPSRRAAARSTRAGASEPEDDALARKADAAMAEAAPVAEAEQDDEY